MAITRDQIIAVATELLTATGQPPTNSQVRDKLGTGSMATISPILKEWRETLAPPIVAASPTEPTPRPVIDALLSVAPQIWSAASTLANELLTAERTRWTTERTELQAALADLETMESRASADLETAQAQIADLTASIDELRTNHAGELEKQTTARIAAEQAAAVLQAINDQMQTRINELHGHTADLQATVEQLRADLKGTAYQSP